MERFKLYIKEVNEYPDGKLGPWKAIWRNNVPTKVKCFSGWLPKSMLHSNEAEETNNHLFLHCKVTTQLWNLFGTNTS
ncbi:hypothetical protein H5410_008306 [Solanum commersonii]|uniref:Uncharacterized protein n=1 Tax=Solanum commersonii TaxID=4109 RepID=A0A9J6AET7_SOLCO|nr:hypothetical protein H5410_008306 [Solanum commersonii]